MKTHDTLGRPLPGIKETKVPYDPNEREIRWMQFLLTHGPLATPYLYEHTKDTHKGADHAIRCAEKLRKAHLIELPEGQFETHNSFYNRYVYDVSRDGIRYLDTEDALVPDCRPAGHWVHGYMTSCLSASMHIEAERDGVEFISQADIIERANTTLGAMVLGKKLIPDQLFGLKYPTGYRFFCLEADRGTEARSSTLARKNYRDNIKQYIQFVGNKQYEDHYDMRARLRVLYVFNRESKQKAFMEELAAQTGKCDYISTQVIDGFRPGWKPPAELYSHLYHGEWDRVGYPPLLISS
jgi:hypothetical protein